MISLISYRASIMILKIYIITLDVNEREKEIINLSENIYLSIFIGVTGPGLACFFQNTALLINVERWKAILAGRSTASIRKKKINQDRNSDLSDK